MIVEIKTNYEPSERTKAEMTRAIADIMGGCGIEYIKFRFTLW